MGNSPLTTLESIPARSPSIHPRRPPSVRSTQQHTQQTTAPVPFPSPRLPAAPSSGSDSDELPHKHAGSTSLTLNENNASQRSTSQSTSNGHASTLAAANAVTTLLMSASPFVGSPLSYASHYFTNSLARQHSSSLAANPATVIEKQPVTLVYSMRNNLAQYTATGLVPRQVLVMTSYDGWKARLPLIRVSATDEFVGTLDLPPGTHRIKFIVVSSDHSNDEGTVCCSRDLPTAQDEDGGLVNYIEVVPAGNVYLPLSSPLSHHVPISEPVVSKFPTSILQQSSLPNPVKSVDPMNFQPPIPPQPTTTTSYLSDTSIDNIHTPTSPTSSYTSDIPALSSFSNTATPPSLPPHLTKVLLNVYTPVGNTGSGLDEEQLSVPHHVVLNHLYACSIRDGVMAVAVSSRYRKKYITTVMYRPVGPPEADSDSDETVLTT